MPRYMDADLLKSEIDDTDEFDGMGVKYYIDAQPTADVVEVVRCKDCRYCKKSYDPKTQHSEQVCGYVGYNPVQSSCVSDTDFCSHGAKMDESRCEK